MPSNVLPAGPMRWATTANKAIPIFASSGNANMPVQSGLWASRSLYWYSTGSAGGNAAGAQVGGVGIGSAPTAAGTYTGPALATTSLYTIQPRGAYATVVTTTNQQVGIRPAAAAGLWLRGASAGQGGFLFVCRFGIEAWTAGDRLFVGMSAATTALTTGDPSAIVNMLGFGIDAGDTAITFMHNDGSGTATKTAIAGTTLAALQGYDAYIFCKPNDSTVYYRLDDVNARTTLVDTSTATDLPVNTTFLSPAAVMGNASNALVTAAQIGVVEIYLESDR